MSESGQNSKSGKDKRTARRQRRQHRMGDVSGGSSNLWLVTFTDIMALMLTFFVLLYSMSNPEEYKWSEMARALKKEFSQEYGPKMQRGSKDVLNIQRLEQDQALSLSYLAPLIRKQLEQAQGLDNIVIFRNAGRLIMAMPGSLVFEPGSTRISQKGEQTLHKIAGMLGKIRNAVEIIGHTDPRPIAQGADIDYKNNWSLSLARAGRVAGSLKKRGYRGELSIRGVAQARFTELPESLPENKRQKLSRRVDIVIETFE